MSDYIHIEKEYFNIMDLDSKEVDIQKRDGSTGKERISIGLEEVVLLSKIISFASETDSRKNTNHACRCSNAYFMDLMHRKEKAIQRSLRALKEFNLIFVYEYKPEAWLTKERYIFPNWDHINEVCKSELTSYEIPEYVIKNTEKQQEVKNDFRKVVEKSKMTSTPVKNDTLIIDSNRYIVLDFPNSSDDESGNGNSLMEYTTYELLYAYLKYDLEVFDVTSNMEKNMNDLSETEIKEFLSSKGFNINDYSQYRDDIVKGCGNTLRCIEDDKRYEEEELQREIELNNKAKDEEEAWLEQQMALLEDPYYLENCG